jgi:outer membrane lipoprotein-sorting protein
MSALLAMVLMLEDEAKAREALEAASAALREAPAIAFDVQIASKGNEPTKLKLILQRPDRARAEYDQGLMIADGKTAWYYVKEQNQFIKQKQASSSMLAGLVPVVASLYYEKGAAALLKDAKHLTLATEKLGDEECSVVGYTDKRGIQWNVWLDAKRLVRKAVMTLKQGDTEIENTVTYSAMTLAPKLAEDTFVFKPPKDATEVETGNADFEKSLVAPGAAAPDFTATDLMGGPVKLSGYKGKTVILNFWFYG